MNRLPTELLLNIINNFDQPQHLYNYLKSFNLPISFMAQSSNIDPNIIFRFAENRELYSVMEILLLSKKVDVKDPSTYRFYNYACQKGNLQIVKRFLRFFHNNNGCKFNSNNIKDFLEYINLYEKEKYKTQKYTPGMSSNDSNDPRMVMVKAHIEAQKIIDEAEKKVKDMMKNGGRSRNKRKSNKRKSKKKSSKRKRH